MVKFRSFAFGIASVLFAGTDTGTQLPRIVNALFTTDLGLLQNLPEVYGFFSLVHFTRYYHLYLNHLYLKCHKFMRGRFLTFFLVFKEDLPLNFKEDCLAQEEELDIRAATETLML